MNQWQKLVKNIAITVGAVATFFCMSLILENIFQTYTLIPAMFALAVFLVSLMTEGYLYGILASLLGVLAVNFAFTFPYFKFNFTIPENLVSAIIMLAITMLTGTLTTKVRQQDKMRAETEREKMRANLLRAVSHDLRTPLTTIFGSSSVIMNQYDELSKEQILQLSKGIQEDSQWLIEMVENLLSVTKVNGGSVHLNKTPTVLEELIDTVLIRFKKRYPEQKIQVEIPDEFVIIPMDALLIEQVIVNILENAVQHAHGMTKLILRVFVIKNHAIFEIIDDGCGVAKEHLQDIFTGYYEKKDAPVDSQKKSMGIGLSVCASIVKAHDGEISVGNKKEGGCCFRFALATEEENHE